MTTPFDSFQSPKPTQRWSWLSAPWSAPLFGGDYNPEQWTPAMGFESERIWREDMRLMQRAQISLVTIGVFSWVSLQPDEATYTFDWLDRVMDLLAEHSIGACLGTGTAAQPAWLSQRYPDVLPVDATGHRRRHGHRQNYCPTSPDFRRLARLLAERLAERYQHHPALQIWHISNEYYGGATDQGLSCHCERCATHFREWLQARYVTLAALNRAWVTPFWGHTYTEWSQIAPPSPIGETSIQGLSLDFHRFLSDVYLECYLNEAQALRAITPTIPVTTNFMGTYKQLNYHQWAPHVDMVAWDSYPTPGEHPSVVAFRHDVMRGLKPDTPWLLMEQTPGQVHWLPANPLKRPGEVRRLSYQALGHGANSAMFFQWRQSRGAQEMYVSGIVGNAGHEQTRIFREVTQIGSELTQLGRDYLLSTPRARVALLFSWPNWWAVEYPMRPSQQVLYLEQMQIYYRALWEQHIAVDVIAADADLAAYDLVIAPLWNLVTGADSERVATYVHNGGTFLSTFFSSVVDETGRAWLGGAPGPLSEILGIWVEESDPLLPDTTNALQFAADDATFICSNWCDVVHLTSARALATFTHDYYQGQPAITENRYGQGRALYVATQPNPEGVAYLIAQLQHDLRLTAPLHAPPLVEVLVRWYDQSLFYHLINHSAVAATIPLPQPMRDHITGRCYRSQVDLAAGDIMVLSFAVMEEE